MTTERFRTGYTRLFDVRLLHHYWLDDAAAVLDTTVPGRRLLTYDVRRLLAVQPSTATAAAVAGLRGVFRTTGLGFLVAVPDDAVLPPDVTWEFVVTVAAADYASYTALSLRAGVPVLSNLTGTGRGSGANRRLFLSRPYVDGAGAGDGVEALVTDGTDLRQLTGDPPNAPFQVLGPASGHPVYVHQGDVPAGGVETAAAAVIRLTPRRPDDNTFSFANANGTPRTPVRVFEVHLRNRWTTWRYRDRSGGAVTATEAAPLPLTYFGNAGTKQKPSTAAVDVEFDPATSGRIARLVSDIYT